MEELQLRLVIDKDLPREVPGAVAFGDFSESDGGVVYPQLLGLGRFFFDLIAGRPLPLTLCLRGVDSASSLLLATLFLHRELAINPGMPGLIASAEMVDQLGLMGHAHIDKDLSRLFRFISEYLPHNSDKMIIEQRVPQVLTWIREYILEGSLPALPPEPEPPTVIEVGSNGFVLATSNVYLEEGWLALFRQGYLRVVLMNTIPVDRVRVLAAKKSHYLDFNLNRAADIFNESEVSMGERPEWVVDRDLWLRGPKSGTLLLPSDIMRVLTHT